LHRKPVATSLDQFFAVFPRSGPVFGRFSILGNRLRLRLPNLEGKNRTGPDLKTLNTVTFKNHPSMLLYPDAANKYLTEELVAGRMLGPFSLQQVGKIPRGPVFSSPLLVSVQTQQPDMPDEI
jgi:hypothetical protein